MDSSPFPGPWLNSCHCKRKWKRRDSSPDLEFRPILQGNLCIVLPVSDIHSSLVPQSLRTKSWKGCYSSSLFLPCLNESPNYSASGRRKSFYQWPQASSALDTVHSWGHKLWSNVRNFLPFSRGKASVFTVWGLSENGVLSKILTTSNMCFFLFHCKLFKIKW